MVARFAPVQEEQYVPQFNPADGPFTTHESNGESKIIFAKAGFATSPDNNGTLVMTVPELLQIAAVKHGNKPALRVEDPMPEIDSDSHAPPSSPHDKWKTWTYGQFYDDSESVAKGCISLGHKQHDAVVIFGFNSPSWMISEMGAMMAGGKACGVYPSDTVNQLAFKVKHSSASVAFVEGAPELHKFKKIIETIPYLKAIVCWAYIPNTKYIVRKDGSKVYCMTFEDLLATAQQIDPVALHERRENIKPTHCCLLIYTSGTTATPKGVMLSHDNVIFEATTVCKRLPFICKKYEQERVLSYMPLSHAASMLTDFAFPIATSASNPGWMTVYFARPYDLKMGKLQARLQCVRPTIFMAVPRVWDKIAEMIKEIEASTKGAKRIMAKWARSKGSIYQSNLQIGGFGKKPHMYTVAEKLLFRKVNKNLGLDKCKFILSGAAPLTRDTLEFFGSLGININECYGMTECFAAVACTSDECHEWGTIGYAVPGCEVKVFKVHPESINVKSECPKAHDVFTATEQEQGEICFRGRNTMMGYLACLDMGPRHVDEIRKKNAEAVDADGWLHSGDKGVISTRGMIKITGRYKELIIGAAGENIAPVPIEDEIKKRCGAVSNVMMIGDKHKFNVCFITLKALGATGELPGGNKLTGEAASLIPGVTTISEAMRNGPYVAELRAAIDGTNGNGKVCPSIAAKIQKFMILPRDFSVETGELTATLKLKRGAVMEKYEESVKLLYSTDGTYVKHISLESRDHPAHSL